MMPGELKKVSAFDQQYRVSKKALAFDQQYRVSKKVSAFDQQYRVIKKVSAFDQRYRVSKKKYRHLINNILLGAKSRKSMVKFLKCI